MSNPFASAFRTITPADVIIPANLTNNSNSINQPNLVKETVMSTVIEPQAQVINPINTVIPNVDTVISPTINTVVESQVEKIVYWKDKKLRQFAPTSVKSLKSYFLTVNDMTDEKGLRLKKPAVCDVIIEKMLQDLEATSVKGLNHQYIDSIWTALKMQNWKERDNIRKERENVNYHKLSFDFDSLTEIED